MTTSPDSLMRLAEDEARGAGRADVGVIHLFIAACRLAPAALERALRAHGTDPVRVRRRARALASEGARRTGDVTVSTEARAVLDGARSLATTRGGEPDEIDVLVAICAAPDTRVARVLSEIHVVPSALAAVLLTERAASPAPAVSGHGDPFRAAGAFGAPPPIAAPAARAPSPPPAREPAPVAKPGATSPLSRYGRDYTAAARNGELEPIVGRAEELTLLAQILLRKSKSNAVLVGDAGVGKTAIVEGFAQRLLGEGVPEALRGLRVVELSLTSLVAGTKLRGEFEERLEAVIAEAEADRNLVLFLDEIHMLVGAGDARGSMDAANILKPALARGKLRVIGATTPDEFRNSIEDDPALERRFQPVRVDEPSPAEARTILAGIVRGLSKHHGLAYDDDAIDASIALGVRYLPDRRLPDKARDLLDQAGAAKRLAAFGEGAPASGAASGERTVNRADIARIVAEWTGVPVERMSEGERQRLVGLEAALRRRVVGQDEAVDAIADVVRAGMSGLSKPGRPRGVMLLVGPTGVGKTELCKALAEILFGDEKALHRFDMAEYHDGHTVQRLIGAPPGYKGHEEGGQLTNAVRREPHSIVLFDEVEKADPAVTNIFLSIFDDGRLTDAHGRVADFSSTFCVMTSNALGSDPRAFGRRGRAVGFQSEPDPEAQRGRDEESLRRALGQAFRPEIVGRIGRIIELQPFGPRELALVLDNVIERLAARVATHNGIALEVGADVRAALLATLGTPMTGARGIEQLVERAITHPLSEGLVDGRFADARRVRAFRDPGGTIALEAGP